MRLVVILEYRYFYISSGKSLFFRLCSVANDADNDQAG